MGTDGLAEGASSGALGWNGERSIPGAVLRVWASEHEGACYGPGEDGYCKASEAEWSLAWLGMADLSNCFDSPEDAGSWLDEEIKSEESEGLNRGWRRLLSEEIREEVCVLIRDGRAHIWDGWHRVAASLATGRLVKAIVGRPFEPGATLGDPQGSPWNQLMADEVRQKENT
ncbi:hypothetical protein [Ottowia sp.]|uniref:hypothetical protein n=1 Tax=Ottowia sp. TaxID=1898956 RepID=UPI0025FCA99D|nr:hypothetical protein [Ottowia sp.]MBK6616400.1 hypothetical protein [Ottowia sp.]